MSWVERYGADTVRAYLMFIGPWDMGGPGTPQGIEGVARFLDRAWAVVTETVRRTRAGRRADVERRCASCATSPIAPSSKVTDDIEAFKFNTLIAGLMEFNNYLVKAKDDRRYGTPAWEEALDMLLLMLAPETPHIAEELWQRRHGAETPSDGAAARACHVQAWPQLRSRAGQGRHRSPWWCRSTARCVTRSRCRRTSAKRQARDAALASPVVQSWLEGQTCARSFFAGGKLINIVVG